MSKPYQKLSWLLSPTLIEISVDAGKYIVQSRDFPLNKPEPLPEFVNRAFRDSEFVDQVKRYFTLKNQNKYAPTEAFKREQENCANRIKELIKTLDEL